MTDPKEPEKCEHDKNGLSMWEFGYPPYGRFKKCLMCGLIQEAYCCHSEWDKWAGKGIDKKWSVHTKKEKPTCPFCKNPAKERDQGVERQTISIYNWRKGVGEEKEYVLYSDYQALEADRNKIEAAFFDRKSQCVNLEAALEEAKKEIEERGIKIWELNSTLEATNKRVKELETMIKPMEMIEDSFWAARKKLNLDHITPNDPGSDMTRHYETIIRERDELKANIAAMEGQDHADRCAQSKRLKLQIAELERQAMLDMKEAKDMSDKLFQREEELRYIYTSEPLSVPINQFKGFKKQIEELVKNRDALKNYVYHKNSCNLWHENGVAIHRNRQGFQWKCNCDLEEALGMGGKENDTTNSD